MPKEHTDLKLKFLYFWSKMHKLHKPLEINQSTEDILRVFSPNPSKYTNLKVEFSYAMFNGETLFF